MRFFPALSTIIILLIYGVSHSAGPVTKLVHDPGHLEPIDSVLKVQVGDIAPDFNLKNLERESVRLSDFKGKANVVLSFIPAAWTPICSDQWPGYNIVMDTFEKKDTVLLGLSVDNIPTLDTWTRQIGGMKFEILSDFWPHGAVADSYGVLRTNGTAERSLFFINKEGVITGIIVSDVNVRPPLEDVFAELEKF